VSRTNGDKESSGSQAAPELVGHPRLCHSPCAPPSLRGAESGARQRAPLNPRTLAALRPLRSVVGTARSSLGLLGTARHWSAGSSPPVGLSHRLLKSAWRRAAGAPALNGGEQVAAPTAGPLFCGGCAPPGLRGAAKNGIKVSAAPFRTRQSFARSTRRLQSWRLGNLRGPHPLRSQ
jgi:hypothetical protein